MVHWVLKDWYDEENRFIIPGPVSGSDVHKHFQGQFPDDAVVEITEASGELNQVSFHQLPGIELASGDTLALPGIPVAAGPLLYVMDRLLGPDGCPWDKKQTPETLIRYLLDESYEAAEALVANDTDAFIEELGDVLLQVVFQGAMLSGTSFADIAARQAQKLIRRHPHVFSGESWDTSDEVRKQWDNIKAEEPGHQRSAAWVFPALVAAKRLSKARIFPQSAIYQEFLALLEVYFDKDSEKIEEILADAAWAVAAGGSIHHQDAEWALWRKLAEVAQETGARSRNGGKKRISRSLGE